MNILVDHIPNYRQPNPGLSTQTIDLAGVPRIGEYVTIDDYVHEVVEVHWVAGEEYAAMLRVRPA